MGFPEDYQAGERRAAVIFCHGFTAIKEIFLLDNAKRLQADGYITLNFDYRYFGGSGGEPRSRLIPMAQVTDIRNAMTFMQHQPEVNPDRIGLYGTSFGCANATYTAGIDERAKCTVAVGRRGALLHRWDLSQPVTLSHCAGARNQAHTPGYGD